ncbi:CD302 antigen isoform 3-T3 [Liasis olivaceus]
MRARSPASYPACLLSGFLLAAALPSQGADGKTGRAARGQGAALGVPPRPVSSCRLWKYAPSPAPSSAGGALSLPTARTRQKVVQGRDFERASCAAFPPNLSEACPSIAWISFQKSCYALLQGSSEVHSMDDARELCQGNASGADIISINSKDENTFIQSSFCSNWHGPEYVSLGMFFDTDDDIFKWYDDSKVNFTNWIEEESHNELLNTCATMHTVSGGWEKVSCEHLPLTKILCETTEDFQENLKNSDFLVVYNTNANQIRHCLSFSDQPKLSY